MFVYREFEEIKVSKHNLTLIKYNVENVTQLINRITESNESIFNLTNSEIKEFKSFGVEKVQEYALTKIQELLPKY